MKTEGPKSFLNYSNKGVLLSASNISIGWLKAVEHILSCGGKCFNLIVQIEKPTETDRGINDAFLRVCERHKIPFPQKAANTIFPQSIYKRSHKSRERLFGRYIRIYPKVKRGKWGTYFGRMIEWPFIEEEQPINQLEKVIQTMRNRSNVFASAYTIQICSPERNFCQPRGGPCLNFITLQLEKATGRLSMRALYRNHDFITKAYGNYLGLGYLLKFLCDQTKFSLGTLTCVSSHAYINSSVPRNKWKALLKRISQNGAS